MTETKKVGRPSKGEDAKRHSIGIRTTKEIKEAIEAAAAESGRSMAQEIEHRLVESFRREDSLGGRRTSALLRLMAATIADIEAETSKRWHEDYETWHAVREAMPLLLNRHVPRAPNSEAIMATTDALIAAQDEAGALEAELSAANAMPHPNALLADGRLYPEDDHGFFKQRPDGTVRTDEEYQALMQQRRRYAQLHEEVIPQLRAEAFKAMAPANEAKRRGAMLALMLGKDT